ncbi:MAG: C-GCAxxG-C-C family protein [Firmicutes bacterium]|jgi:C_GCAxxG_C_C family probable redox protein|nr:C-GCAxxG-C-C family protein [Bacillota bacterium]
MDERTKIVVESAKRHFESGFNCAESTLLGVAEYLGIRSPSVQSLATGFGGGMGRSDLLCGAVTGAIMGIGLAVDHRSPEDQDGKERVYTLTRKFIEAFVAKYGSCMCTTLAGYNLSTPEGLQGFRDSGAHMNVCPKFVGDAVAIAASLLSAD